MIPEAAAEATHTLENFNQCQVFFFKNSSVMKWNDDKFVEWKQIEEN